MFRLVATCPSEIRSLVVDEIRELGGLPYRESHRAVMFSADERTYYACHLKPAR